MVEERLTVKRFPNELIVPQISEGWMWIVGDDGVVSDVTRWSTSSYTAGPRV